MRGAARTRPDGAYAAARVICTALAIAWAPWALMLSVFP
jgi:asparagine N-glycosylation enzyme membrane subunit Stt3